MDVVQKIADLLRLAADERTPDKEARQASAGALRLVEKYLLRAPGRKIIDVGSDILEKLTNPLFVEGVADRAEKFAGGVERVLGSIKKVSDLSRRSGGKRSGGRRTYGGR